MNTPELGTARQDQIGQAQQLQRRQQRGPQTDGASPNGFAQLLAGWGSAGPDEPASGQDAAVAASSGPATTESQAQPLAVDDQDQETAHADDNPAEPPAGWEALLQLAGWPGTTPPTTPPPGATGPGQRPADPGQTIDGARLDTTASQRDGATEDASTQPHPRAHRPGAEPTRNGPPAGKALVGQAVSALATLDRQGGTPTSPVQQLQSALLRGADAPTAWHMATPQQPGSSLAEPRPDATPTPATPQAIDTQGASPSGDGQTQPQLGHNGVAAPATGPAQAEAPTGAAGTGFAQRLHEALGTDWTRLGDQVSVWADQGVQQANLSLRDAQDRPLDVALTLHDGQAHLDFRSNDSATRDALQQHAQAALSELLGQHGLGLAGVSVGAHHPGSGQGPAPDTAQRGLAVARGPLDQPPGTGDAQPLAAPLAAGVRLQRGLDVYA